MNSKWYISTFIVLLVLLGLNREQTKVANQQIVVQFTDTETTSLGTCDTTLATITKKLHALGITEIEIVESDDAKLTIRYYSDIDALSVREFLSEDGTLALTYDAIDKLPLDTPEDEIPESFSLVVSDLQEKTADGQGLNGKFAFELKQDYKTLHNTDVIDFNYNTSLKQCAIVKVAYKTYTGIAIAIDNASRTIPEVRAGPFV